VSKGLEEAGDSSVSPLNSDLGESEDVGVEAIEEAVRSPGVEACFQFDTAITVNQANRDEYSRGGFLLPEVGVEVERSIDPSADERVVFIRRNKNQEWRGEAYGAGILIELIGVRAAGGNVAAVEHDPFAEETRVRVSGPRHFRGAILSGYELRTRGASEIYLNRSCDESVDLNASGGGFGSEASFDIGRQLDTHGDPE